MRREPPPCLKIRLSTRSWTIIALGPFDVKCCMLHSRFQPFQPFPAPVLSSVYNPKVARAIPMMPTSRAVREMKKLACTRLASELELEVDVS